LSGVAGVMGPRHCTRNPRSAGRVRYHRAPMKPYDLGVLFVHGIGLQTRADTMLHWGEELHTRIAKWIAGATGGSEDVSVQVADALIGQNPLDRAAPAHTKWTVTVPKGRGQRSPSTWLVAESCWAESFVTPRYADFASWSFRTLPWTLASHFGRRL